MEKSHFDIEKELVQQGFEVVIGTDEVGRGPLCGPVVASAVAYRDINFEMPEELEKQFDLIRDSKKLSEKQREEIFDFIGEHFYVGIGLCDHETIDRINILEASFLSMKKAIQELQRKIIKERHSERSEGFNGSSATAQNDKIVVLVDGNKEIPNLTMQQFAIVGGDKVSKSISAASIVAKVTRDRMMKEFAIKYPEYGLEKHMGYGTKIHMQALIEHGPCPIHRKSFGPVKKALKRA